jgi:hypothetical protein
MACTGCADRRHHGDGDSSSATGADGASCTAASVFAVWNDNDLVIGSLQPLGQAFDRVIGCVAVSFEEAMLVSMANLMTLTFEENAAMMPWLAPPQQHLLVLNQR